MLDPSRVTAYVVTGIGFLGGGAILKHGVNVRGLTTAASLWVVAAIGTTSAVGLYGLAVITAGIALFSLWPLRRVVKALGLRARGTQRLTVELGGGRDESPRSSTRRGPRRRHRVRKLSTADDSRVGELVVDGGGDASARGVRGVDGERSGGMGRLRARLASQNAAQARRAAHGAARLDGRAARRRRLSAGDGCDVRRERTREGALRPRGGATRRVGARRGLRHRGRRAGRRARDPLGPLGRRRPRRARARGAARRPDERARPLRLRARRGRARRRGAARAR